jgi:Tfp pilus assembly protein PilV
MRLRASFTRVIHGFTLTISHRAHRATQRKNYVLKKIKNSVVSVPSVAKNKMTRNRRQFGFTLIEATFAMVLLAIAAAGILLPFANATSLQIEAARQTTAANLASELLERIQACEYSDIISIYDGYTESQSNGTLVDATGTAHSGTAYSGFSRTANCCLADVGTLEDILTAVTVTVFFDGREVTKVMTLVGDHQ